MEKAEKTTTFEDLYERDIKKYVEKLKKTYKDKRTGQEKFFELSYLSWAYGHREMKRIDPDAKERVVEFPLVWQGNKIDGVYVPYLQTSQGFFVKCEVTINGRTESEWLPVLDNSNRPINNPTTFQINTSHKRCFVKALAKHGLGLYLYVGEDLPENITQKESETQVTESNQQQSQPNKQQAEDTPPTYEEWVNSSYESLEELTGWEKKEITVMLEGKAGGPLRGLERNRVVAVINESIAELKKQQRTQSKANSSLNKALQDTRDKFDNGGNWYD